MAKKQVFGDQALQAKMAQRKMAKVIISKKNVTGSVSFNEAIVDQEKAKEFISKHK